jgi:ribonuclease HI
MDRIRPSIPSTHSREGQTALKWSLCPTFTDRPTLIALITPILPTSHGYHKFRSHLRVTSICYLPPAALKLNERDQVVSRECNTPYLARPIEILLVANIADIIQLLQPDDRTSPLHTRLQAMQDTIRRHTDANVQVTLHPATWQNVIVQSLDSNPFKSTNLKNPRQLNLPIQLNRLPQPQIAAITASIARHPTLRFAQTSLTYTDGSKQGSHIGAGVHIAHSQQYVVIGLTGKNSALNTVERAELAAIQAALAQPCPVIILTDSATSIHQTTNILNNPTRFRVHNHKLMLVRIAHDMLYRAAQGHTTHIYKVRAHNGVKGNEIADAAAKIAATPPEALTPCPSFLHTLQRVNQTISHSTEQALGPTWYKIRDRNIETYQTTRLITTANLKQGLNSHIQRHYQRTYNKQQTMGDHDKTIKSLLQVQTALQLRLPPINILDSSITQIRKC